MCDIAYPFVENGNNNQQAQYAAVAMMFVSDDVITYAWTLFNQSIFVDLQRIFCFILGSNWMGISSRNLPNTCSCQGCFMYVHSICYFYETMTNQSTLLIVSTATNYLMNFVIGQITPVMLDNITYGTYFFFFATNVCCNLIVYFFYPGNYINGCSTSSRLMW